MPFGEILRVALEALRVNKMRSVLTMLGIIIGVGAVIAMLALGNGAKAAVNERIQALGTTLVTVVPGQVFTGGIASSTDRAQLKTDDYEMLLTRGTTWTAVEPEMSRNQQVQYLTANTNTNIIGATANYPDVRRYSIGVGHMFTENDDLGRKRVAVIGATTATNLGVTAPAGLIGQQIRINGVAFDVIGVFAAKGGATGFNDPDDQIVIPLGTARFRLFGTENLRSINLLAPSEDKIDEVMAEAEKIMRRSHRLAVGRPNDFQIRTQADFLNTAAETTQVFTYLLAGVALVSLLVGGIGIMNIMLVSVTERTREVGVRKALGATRKTILAQFLIEAVVLCALGGVIGILAGTGTAAILHSALDWNTQVSIPSIVVAFVFSAAVGIIFGVWPARRAASLDPILALRYE
ncbi:MacB-like periplasmic core domain protein [Gemmatirosa kalamazoonensis]|uniref:MacB-like periplasmic core domain protein n=1 Tax=Gemmatirosa kalamazoonensis TaxID=861299 RepID=W0RJC3_9BACT|nr:ABC transporter permease [Gemmatirosa kalamazoonensis]AHG89518.1 MacB-like periplasmic core domain protein [Gemmatirosa kalamazoonensis]